MGPGYVPLGHFQGVVGTLYGHMSCEVPEGYFGFRVQGFGVFPKTRNPKPKQTLNPKPTQTLNPKPGYAGLPVI